MSLGVKERVVRSYYDALEKKYRVDHQLVCTPEEDMCRQSDKDSCDINRIVKHHLAMMGSLPPIPEQVFADVSQGWDYREVMEKAREAELYFEQLPSGLREKYANNVGVFLDRIGLEENLEDAIQLGFVEKPVEPEVPNEVPANPPA